MKIKSLTGIDIVGKVRNIPEAAGREKPLLYRCGPGFVCETFVHAYTRSNCSVVRE